jgi:hypothetical protein
MEHKKLIMNDVIFLAILSAALLLVSSLAMPLVMFTDIFGLRQLASALFFGLFIVVGLTKVPKKGTLLIIGLCTGVVLLFMSPIMFWNNVIGALLTEFICFLVFRGYERKASKFTAATLFIPLTLPVTLISSSIIKNESISTIWGEGILPALMCLGTILMSVFSSWLGFKICAELKRTGKLKYD